VEIEGPYRLAGRSDNRWLDEPNGCCRHEDARDDDSNRRDPHFFALWVFIALPSLSVRADYKPFIFADPVK